MFEKLFFKNEREKISSGGYTIPKYGRRPEENEDAYYQNIEDPVSHGVFDGVSTANNSRGTSQQLARELSNFSPQLSRFLRTPDISRTSVEEKLRQWVDAVDLELRGRPASTGVLSFTYKVEGKQYTTFIHKGDSRAYILRNGMLTQVTEDHSESNRKINDLNIPDMEKARIRAELDRYDGTSNNNSLLRDLFKVRHKINSSFGDRNSPYTLNTYEINPGDLIILASDGVGDNLTPEEIRDISIRYKNDPRTLAKKLVDESKRSAFSGKVSSKDDDTTAVVFSPTSQQELSRPHTETKSTNLEIGDTVRVTFKGGIVGKGYTVTSKGPSKNKYTVQSPEGRTYENVDISFIKRERGTGKSETSPEAPLYSFYREGRNNEPILETGWRYLGQQNGKAILERVINGKRKNINVRADYILPEQPRQNEKVFQVGSQVNVKRSDGRLENDWKISSIEGNIITVHKVTDPTLNKNISFEELARYNP